MKKYFFIFAVFLLISNTIFSKEKIVFGYFLNDSNNSSYEYLETIIPDSLVSSLLEHDYELVRPKELNKILEKKFDGKYNIPNYQKDEKFLIDIKKGLSADYFVYGNFLPLNESYIKLRINIFCVKSEEIFTFETIGRLETEIFTLVDYLSSILFNFSSKYVFFKNEVIPNRSKLSIISNLKDTESNVLYSTLLENGYSISTVQSSDYSNIVIKSDIDNFNYIISKNYKFDKARKKLIDFDKLNIIYGSWHDKSDFEKADEKEKFLKLYYYDFAKEKSNVLKNLSNATNGSDYLIILNFNKNRKKCQIRCLDLKSSKLIWMERNLEASKENTKEVKDDFNALINTIIDNFLKTSTSGIN